MLSEPGLGPCGYHYVNLMSKALNGQGSQEKRQISGPAIRPICSDGIFLTSFFFFFRGLLQTTAIHCVDLLPSLASNDTVNGETRDSRSVVKVVSFLGYRSPMETCFWPFFLCLGPQANHQMTWLLFHLCRLDANSVASLHLWLVSVALFPPQKTGGPTINPLLGTCPGPTGDLSFL